MLAALQESALVVKLAQDRQCLLQQTLGLALLLDDLLELGVLLLTVLPGQLQLLLHVSDLALQGFDVALWLGNVNGLLLGQQSFLSTCLVLCLQLILAELFHAKVLLLHLIGLFILQGKDHVIHGLLNIGEFVDLHLHRQAQNARILGLGQSGGRLGHPGGFFGLLQEAEGLGEVLMRFVSVQDLHSLGDRLRLLRTGLLALVPLGVHVGALLLHFLHERQVGAERSLGVFDLLLLDGTLLISIGLLFLLRFDLLGSSFDLLSLCGGQGLELLDGRSFILLDLCDLRREVVLQAGQNTHDAIHSVTALQEGLKGVLVLRGHLLRMLGQDGPQRLGGSLSALQEGCAFRRAERGLCGGDALQVGIQTLQVVHIFLVLLFPQSRGGVQSRLILGHFILGLLHFRLQSLALGQENLHSILQLSSGQLRFLHSLFLGHGVVVAPALELVISLFIRFSLGFQLFLHSLQ
mmetsp:Transcript_16070/g.27317  ORF Transcript_16070/g.27317 Transcript_16070/m.27317 type:complete len:464 (+) Transcript_16070:475-1866(+)